MIQHRPIGGGTKRPYFTDNDFERIAEDELTAQGLFPSSPRAIRVERFIERRFGITPAYDRLPVGILGYTEFGPGGSVQAVIVSRHLSERGSRVDERRLNTTLAHEAGHGLLHAHLFALDTFPRDLFGDTDDVKLTQILCREEASSGPMAGAYQGRWWEYQANRMMGALLLPKSLVAESLKNLVELRGMLKTPVLPPGERDVAARRLAGVFDVNPVVARIRIDQLYPVEDLGQLTL